MERGNCEGINHDSNFTSKQLGISNPFISEIEKYLTTENLAARLAISPLDGLNIRALGMQERMDYLDRLQEEFFEPTSSSLEIATRIFRLIRRGYLNRNPTLPSVRKMTMEIAGFSGMELSALPWYSSYAKGMTIQGVTGVGKSYEIRRVLTLLPQVVEHGRVLDAGWGKMKQVVWLYVAMSHDGSLGGLLLQIIQELDHVIGTNYSQDTSLIKLSNEKLAVRLGVILRNHGVGALFIDEIQSRNFEGKGLGRFAATFFLRLLNFGIPVVLIGNPLGLSALYSFSQDMRRIGSGGTVVMHPLEFESFDWGNCLAAGLWRQNLMPESSSISDLEGKMLFYYSGGIRDYASRIIIASQRLALDLGDRVITEEHMHNAFLGADFSDKDRDMIVGFRDKNPILLVQFEDVPWEEYASYWNRDKDDSGDEQHIKNKPEALEKSLDGMNSIHEKQKPVPQKDREQMNRNRTREKNKTKSRENSRGLHEPSDMRRDGLKEYLVNGLESILAEGGQDAKF